MRYLYPLLIALGSMPAMAGHYSGGNLTYTCDGTDQYIVTLQLFVDCSGADIVPQDITFSSDCGTTYTVQDLPASAGTEVSQLCEAQIGNSTCNGGSLPGMRLYEFTTIQDLGSCDDWTISWNICCRASSINLVGNPGMYIETTVHNATEPCEGSPVFTEDALPYVCVDQPVSYNFGVSDVEGDSLSYAFLEARTWVGNEEAPVVYQTDFTGAEPIPGITLDAATGQVAFTPALVGYYIVAGESSPRRSLSPRSPVINFQLRYDQPDCSNTNPDADSGTVQNLSGSATLDGDYALLACGSPSFCFDATITDADDLQSLTLSSNVDQVLSGATFEVSGTNPATATVCWNGQGASPGTYVFTINATDDACPQPASQILSYSITISEGPNAGVNSSATLCSDGPPPNLFDLLNGDPDPDGVFTEVQPGVYHYVVPAVGDCAADSSVLPITTVQAADAGLDNGIAVCANGDAVQMLDSLLGTPTPGGVWTDPQGTPHPLAFDPAVDPPGIYCYVVEGTPPCANAIACLTITLLEASDPACLGTATAGPSDENTVLIQPEPNNGHFRVRFAIGTSRLDVLDLSGRVVMNVPVGASSMIVDVDLPSALNAGRYVLRTVNDGSTHQLPFTLVR